MQPSVIFLVFEADVKAPKCFGLPGRKAMPIPLFIYRAEKSAKFDGSRIVVRTCEEGTPFMTLDGVERKLTANDLMICSAAKPTNNYKFINLANKFYTFRHVATLDNAPETPSAPSSYSVEAGNFGNIADNIDYYLKFNSQKSQ